MNFSLIDQKIAGFMEKWGITALRISLAVIFFWFGILKPLGVSAAAPLVLATVKWMPGFSPEGWLHVIGWWEVVIGITFLFRATTRVAIGLMFLQMAGTFMPLVLLPGTTWQAGGLFFLPTLEGQYIIKNLLIISSALVIGGATYGRKGS